MAELSSRIKKYLTINIIIAVIGSIVSIYSINHHLDLKQNGVTSAACNINQTISCDAVAASEYSELFGLPLGAFGLAFFLVIFVMSMIIRQSDKSREANLGALAIISAIGAVVSVGLGGLSIFVISSLCLTCIAVYILTFVLFGNAFLLMKAESDAISFKGSFNGLITAGIITAVVILGYSQLAPGPDPSTHPNYVSDSGTNQDAPPTLSSKTFDIPVNLSPYSGYGEDYRKGSDQARVTIVEFADFECPACARVSQTINDLAKKYGSRVNIVFKNYPLDQKCNSGMSREFHKHACDVAVLARCAGQKGKFWQYHDLAFQNQSSLAPGMPEKLAKTVGLTDQEIKACLSNKGIIDKIKDDIKLANDVGLQGTPSIYINGKKFLGNPNFYALSLEIEKLLN